MKKMFNKFQWESHSSKILLTFDDGPNPSTTEMILNELDKFSLKAIFFCVGENIEKHPSITQEILARGHEVGNHTFQHQKINKLTTNDIDESINRIQNYCQTNFSYNIKYFRPPHGRFTLETGSVLRQHDLTNVMWSLLTYDYKNDLNIVKFAVNKYLSHNSIIVLHDSNKSKEIILESIRLIVEEAEKKNYQIGKPSECLRYYSS
jgi:peptidoglycan/xylan/chitin deacetylase (PgdA/CDA1 family)